MRNEILDKVPTFQGKMSSSSSHNRVKGRNL